MNQLNHSSDNGTVVYNARSLYNVVFPDNFTVFQDNCDGAGLYKKDDNTSTANIQSFDATVFPNPTENILYISTNLPADETITIEVIDITGKSIAKQTCLTTYRNCSIALLPNASGIYILKITNTNNDTKRVANGRNMAFNKLLKQ